MNTNRTPQQASIDAREAREAWEITGSIPQYSRDEITWLEYQGLRPNFSDPDYHWRPAPKSTPTITPGKWRMRNGKTIDVVPHDHCIYKWENPTHTISWTKSGREIDDRQDSPGDLLTKVETRWRPWRPEEVPLLREIRKKKDHTQREIIVGTGERKHKFDEWELLQPDGTYVPCGVEEEVK